MRDPRQNPFLVLGVSSDAEMSEIQSVGKRRLMMLRLDDDADPAITRRIPAAFEHGDSDELVTALESLMEEITNR